MKKKWLFLSSSLTTIGLVVPLAVFSLSSCSLNKLKLANYTIYLSDFISSKGSEPEIKEEVDQQKDLHFSSTINASNLIKGWMGQKKLHDYVVFLGSYAFEDTCKFFGGNENPNNHQKNQWFGNKNINFKTNTDFGQKMQTLVSGFSSRSEKHFWEFMDQYQNNFAFYNLFDDYSSAHEVNKDGKTTHSSVFQTRFGQIEIYSSKNQDGEQPVDFIHPFQKWSTDFLNKTKRKNPQIKSTDIHGEYIRTDQAAISYRKFVKALIDAYPNHSLSKTFREMGSSNEEKSLGIDHSNKDFLRYTDSGYFIVFHNGDPIDAGKLSSVNNITTKVKESIDEEYKKWKKKQQKKNKNWIYV